VIALYVLDNVTTPAPTVDTLSPLRFTWAKNAVGANANGAGNVTCALEAAASSRARQASLRRLPALPHRSRGMLSALFGDCLGLRLVACSS
jgi:hypothetical protein